MTSPNVRATSRRHFLQYLAASPLFASGTLSAYGAEAPSKLPDPMIWAPAGGELIDKPEGRDQRVRLRTGGPQERAAGAFRLYGLRP